MNATIRYWRAIVRRAWISVLLLAVGVGTAWYLTSLQTPQYEATVTLLVNPAAPNEQIAYLNELYRAGSAAIPTLVASYNEYIRSRTFTTVAVERLGVAASAAELAKAVRMSLVPNTNVVRLSVTWDSPTEAARIANGLAELFVGDQRPTPAPTPIAGVDDEFRRRSVDHYRRRLDDLQHDWNAVQDNGTLSPEEKSAELSKIENRMVQVEQSYARWSQAAAPTSTKEPSRQPWLGSATILDMAMAPFAPIGGGLGRNVLFGAISGLALAVALSLLLEYLDNAIRGPGDVTQVPGLTVLGSVTRLRRSELNPLDLLRPEHHRSAMAEAYRMIRTYLLFDMAQRPCRTLLVTSPGPGEGKSTTTANLGVVMALLGKRVVVVDADLRRSSIHKLFGTPNTQGLSDLLIDEITRVEPSIQATAIENLSVIPSGPIPTNPLELLQSPRFEQVLRELAERFDTVLIDSPPVLVTADPVVLAAQCDGVVVVVEAGRTSRDALGRTIETLGRGGATIAGVVLNKMSRRDEGYYYYYRYDRYYRHDAASGNGDGSQHLPEQTRARS